MLRLGRATLPRLPRLTGAVTAGVLLCASFPRVNWWWAAVVAFALLAWVLTRPATTPAGGLGYGVLFGLAFYLPLLAWLPAHAGALAWIALAIACAVFPGVFGLAAVVVRRLPGWPVWFAVLWTAQEWLTSTVPFGGFPWGVVAAGQTAGPLLPLARLGGASLLSAAVVLLGCSVTAIAGEIVRWMRRPVRGDAVGTEIGDGPPPAVVLPGICICLVLVATVVVWSPVRRAGTGSGSEPPVTAAAVQAAAPRDAPRPAVLPALVRETVRLADDVRAGGVPQPQFVVWPQDSTGVDPLRDPDVARQISTAAEAIGVPILVGAPVQAPGHTPRDPVATSAVIVWNPGTGPADRHDERIVQPFGETLPWRGFLGRLTALAERAGHVVPGRGAGVVDTAGIPVGIATCWEVLFDRALRDSVRNGAQVLAVPANDAGVDRAMSEQRLAFVRLRAVEHDRYVVVAGNAGASAVIAPDGRELARAGFGAPAHLDTQVRLTTAVTPATRGAALVQGALVVLAAAVVLAGMRHNGWFARPGRRRSRLPDESEAPSGGCDDEDDTPLEGGLTSSPFGAGQRSRMTTGQPASPAAGERPGQPTLVIVPTFNERENLPLIVARLHRARPDVHVLVVDDSSPDGTGELADELAEADPGRIHVMHRTTKDGLGAAYLAGFAWGLDRGYATLVEMDADGSHAPEQLHRLLDAVDAGADLAIGSRYVDGGTVRNWPWRRVALSKIANTYSRLMLGLGVHDITAGYRAYRRDVLEQIDLQAVDSKGYCFQIDLTWRAVSNGFTVVEVPITFTERELGVSKMSGSNIREALVKVAQWGVRGRLHRGRAVPLSSRDGVT
ncbi:apolipoprotein N-acyltransferase [Mycobacterium sp.]|uniref:apolipoprotein N-acyltransferase n=1 Tax=Mycobacterium sp. TaxID=1785 RepID=UPI0031E0FB61